MRHLGMVSKSEGGITALNSKRLHQKVRVTFRFVGDNVDPQEITSLMRMQPSAAHAKGDRVAKHPDRVYPTGFWGLESSIPPDRSLEEHLKRMLSVLEPQASAIRSLERSGLPARFFCGFFIAETDSGAYIEIGPDTLEGIAELRSRLELHIYYVNEED
jgi:hypothetical protein